MKSGRLFSLVTRHWPRIAAVLVAVLGVGELILGGLTADNGLELYMTAWAATTGGAWFLFEKAEKALAEETRERVVQWIREADPRASIESIPAQFAVLFDRIFGERHLTVRCASRSFLASISAVALLSLLLPTTDGPHSYPADVKNIGTGIAFALVVLGAIHPVDKALRPWLRRIGAPLVDLDPRRWKRRDWSALPVWVVLSVLGFVLARKVLPIWGRPVWTLLEPVYNHPGWAVVATWIGGVSLAAFFNFLPDYVSLLQTRWAVRFLQRPGQAGVLLLDLVLTTAISLAFLWIYFVYVEGAGGVVRDVNTSSLSSVLIGVATGGGGVTGWESVYFYSAFFTSVWLWLYAFSVLASRALLRMNSGVGFLLRVTDVENQPFRSMGFVSVIIVSGLFVLGLPFVVL